MQGRKRYEERLFTAINLEEMIPKNHLLVRIDRTIDLHFIYDLTSDLYCSDNGRPSVDPVSFFRMQLIGYLYGIESDRRLCEEIHLNLAYRWFCRLHLEDPVPDHSSLTRIRERFGVETYQAIFEQLIRILRDYGFIKGQKVIVDSTLVEADASVNSLQERDDSDPQARALKNYERCYHDFREGKKSEKYPTKPMSAEPIRTPHLWLDQALTANSTTKRTMPLKEKIGSFLIVRLPQVLSMNGGFARAYRFSATTVKYPH